MNTTSTIHAFDAFKSKNREIFADSFANLCEAEIAFIHAVRENELAEYVSAPTPVRSLCTHPECTLTIYGDGSLFDSNNADSSVWADSRDFLQERFDRDNLTLSGREFFQIETPADPEAADFVVNVRRFFYGPQTDDSLARDEGTVLRFDSRASAEAWVAENAPRSYEPYLCTHNEYARPDYTVIACV